MSALRLSGRLGVIVAFLFVLACLGLIFPFEIAFYVLVGWIWYGLRVIPEVRVDWGGVAMALVCLAGFAGGLHVFLGWLYDQLNNSAEPARIAFAWPARWTAALVAIVVLMFVAGVAATGVGHQVGWLLTAQPLLVSAGGARSAARRAQSVNNLKQIGLAAHNYHAAYEAFPAGATAARYGELLHSWQTALLPYLEQQPLYDQIDRTLPWDDPHNAPAFQIKVNSYLNPAIDEHRDAQGFALSHYAGNARVLGGLHPTTIAEVRDGTSMTILAGEVAGGYLPWGRPGNWRDPALGINRDPDGFGGPYTGGANMIFADGSVKFIKNTIAPEVLKALGTPAGHETVSVDSY
ncbi:MAG: DUF1559 domain-containing protein [Isosphaeraceae bacterium]|nr:DUF1559 domain-containing protein [Isosphaeraceae bacterium]